MAKFKRDPLLVPVPFLEPAQSPSLIALGGPVCPVITTAFSMQVEGLVVEIKKWYERLNYLAQETEAAEKERDRMSEGVCDLLDQRYDVKAEIWGLEKKLKSMKEKLTQLKDRKKELEASGLSLMSVVTSSVSGSSKGASAEPGALK